MAGDLVSIAAAPTNVCRNLPVFDALAEWPFRLVDSTEKT